jgi:hypothetical protein
LSDLCSDGNLTLRPQGPDRVGMPMENPFSPGAGSPPPESAGRLKLRKGFEAISLSEIRLEKLHDFRIESFVKRFTVKARQAAADIRSHLQ